MPVKQSCTAMTSTMENATYSSIGNMVGLTIKRNKDNGVKAICKNCNKRFESMRAITMHLKVTASRHTVILIEHGNYSKYTGLIK
jgi:hypothetical protein